MKKRLSVLLFAAVLACAASLACAAPKTFVFGDTTFNPENEEPNVNPHEAYAGWACIRYGVGETLFRYSDRMEIEPWLAESFERADEKTWKITLRKGVTFTSGRSMDAQAVKECIEHLISVHKRAQGDLNIERMEADGNVLTIVTSQPSPALLNYLSDPYGCIIDMKAGISPDGNVAGTGPFIAVEINSGDHLRLRKNPAYWNGEVRLDEVTVRTITDGDTLTMALQSGEIDAAYGMPYASYPLFENDDYTISGTPTSRAFFAWMNFKSPLTTDPAVRKAIALGIDKEGFVSVLLEGKGYPATGVFPASFTFGGDAVHTEKYDPEAAKAVLEAAGWKDSDGDGVREKDGKKLAIRWLTYPSRQELPLLAESAQSTLKAIGFDVSINCTADSNRIRRDPTLWDVYASAMVTAPTGDPAYFFTSCCLDSSSANNGHYHSDQLEKYAAEMENTFDPAKRGELAVKMQQTILDDNAWVFCSHLRMSMISRKGVTGLVAHPCDFYELTAELDKN